MNTLLNYVSLRNDITFSERPFNDIDALLFSTLAYASWRGIVEEESIPLSDAAEKYILRNKKETDVKEQSISSYVPLLLNEIRESRRYKDVLISNSEYKLSKEDCVQFGAITFSFCNKILIAFEGTDSAIVGWHEDLKMSYLDELPSRRLSAEYVKKINEKFKGNKGDRDLYIAGHSKGGNLAIYATLTRSEIKDRIAKVYSFDGPGFLESFFEKYESNDTLKRVVEYMPEDSVVGRLLTHKGEIKIVESESIGIAEHNACLWHVNADAFIFSDHFRKESDDLKKYIDDNILSKNDDEKRDNIELLFSLLDKLNVQKISDLGSSAIEKGIEALIIVNNYSNEEKQFIASLFKLLWLYATGHKGDSKVIAFLETGEKIGHSISKEISRI